jgi:hypothetical protein
MGALRASGASSGPPTKVGHHLGAARCGGQIKFFDLRARNARAQAAGAGALEAPF